MTHICQLCNKTYSTLYSLRRHFAAVHKGVKYACSNCKRKYSSLWYLKTHKEKCKRQNETNEQSSSTLPDVSMHDDDDEDDYHNYNDNHDQSSTNIATNSTTSENHVTDDEEMMIENMIRTRWASIRTYFKCQRVRDIYNVRLYKQKKSLSRMMKLIWQKKITTQIKLQYDLGFILKNKKTGKLQYYHASVNNANFKIKSNKN